MDESELPLHLPEVDSYLPTETGEPPLGRAKGWHTKDGYPIELCTRTWILQVRRRIICVIWIRAQQ